MTTKRRDYLLVGLTGGIGSGKSQVGLILDGLGRVVLSADGIARKLTDEDVEIQSRLRKAFGNEVFMVDGSLNRKKLSAIVFADPTQLAILNRIVHPRVTKELVRLVDALPVAHRQPYVAIEAALVFESGLDSMMDFIVVVHATKKLRIERVMQRDGFSFTDVTRRMESQISAQDLLSFADFTIENNGTEDELRRRVLIVDLILSTLSTNASH